MFDNIKYIINHIIRTMATTTMQEYKQKYKPSYTPIKELYDMAKEDLTNVEGITFTVKGWIQFSRPQAKVMFLQISDGSHPISFQLIYGGAEDEVRQIVEPKAHVGACVTATGVVVKSPAKGQLLEMKVVSSEVLGSVMDPASFLPSVKGIAMEAIRPHQDKRALFPVYRSIYRIRSKLSKFVHDFMESQLVSQVDVNLITKSACEGGSQQFVITSAIKEGDISKVPVEEKSTKIDFKKDFFGEQAFMTESSQLQLEALCRGMGSVYTMAPSFRAEPSLTRRHLACFTHLEWELPFIELKDLMDFSEDLTKYCFSKVLSVCEEDLQYLEKTISKGVIAKLKAFVAGDYGRITYDEAIEILEKNKDDVMKKFGSEIKELPKFGDDLGSYCERYLAEVHFGKPIFVYNYPLDLKSFYMKINIPHEVKLADGTTEVRRTCQGCDLLMPGLGELIGSSIRESSYEKIAGEVIRRGMDITPLQWYCDLRKDGSGGTGGAGLGFDRLVTVCCSGMDGMSIHDAVPFPVSFKNLKF